MSIAKIFDIDGKQAVVLKNNDPALEFHFEMDEWTASLTINFKDDDKGFDNRDRAFDIFDQEQIEGIRKGLVEDLEEELTEDSEDD